MNTVKISRWSAHRLFIGIAGIITLFVAMIVALQTLSPVPVSSPIPNPFFQAEGTSTLVGSVTRDRYIRRNIPVDEYKFLNGERSELLPVDRIALVHIPDNARIDNVSMQEAIRNNANPAQAADAYGYKYSNAAATAEILNIRADTFAAQFPGQFWTTAEAMTKHRADFESFAAAKNIVWFVASGVNLEPTGSLHVIVSNDQDGAVLTVQRPVCGNGVTESPETCDDGNTVASDGCSAVCRIESGYTCIGTPSICTRTSSSSFSSSSSSSHSDYNCNGRIQSTPCSSSSSSSSSAPVCRNGIREGTEQCDDGNTVDNDACTNECKDGFPVPIDGGQVNSSASSSLSSSTASSSVYEYFCNGQAQSTPCSSSSASSIDRCTLTQFGLVGGGSPCTDLMFRGSYIGCSDGSEFYDFPPSGCENATVLRSRAETLCSQKRCY